MIPDATVEWNYDIEQVYFDESSYRFPIREIDLGNVSLVDKKIYSVISEDMAFEIILDKKLYNSEEGALVNLNRAEVFGQVVRNDYQGTDRPQYYFKIYHISTTDEKGKVIKSYLRK